MAASMSSESLGKVGRGATLCKKQTKQSSLATTTIGARTDSQKSETQQLKNPYKIMTRECVEH